MVKYNSIEIQVVLLYRSVEYNKLSLAATDSDVCRQIFSSSEILFQPAIVNFVACVRIKGLLLEHLIT